MNHPRIYTKWVILEFTLNGSSYILYEVDHPRIYIKWVILEFILNGSP